MKYKYNISNLEAGDIIFERYHDSESDLIAEKTGGQYTHVGLYVGASSVIEATTEIVTASNLSRNLFESDSDVCVMRVKDDYKSDEIIQSAVNYTRLKVGTEYSKNELIYAYLQKYDRSNANRQVCSRLVACAFAAGGLKIVENPAFCSPQQILESELLQPVQNVIVEASEEDEEVASTPSALVDQLESISTMLSRAREISGEDIQTIEQLTEYVMNHPKHDKAINRVVIESGYLDLWKLDKEYHPFQYDETLFRERYKNKAKIAASQVIEALKDNHARFSLNLVGLKQLPPEHRELDYIKTQIELYETLLKDLEDRKNTALKVLGS